MTSDQKIVYVRPEVVELGNATPIYGGICYGGSGEAGNCEGGSAATQDCLSAGNTAGDECGGGFGGIPTR